MQMSRKQLGALGDLALLAAIGVGITVLFIGASTLPPPRFEPLGSAAMPRILGGILILLSIPVAYSATRVLFQSGSDEPKVPVSIPYSSAFVFVALVLYVAALDFGHVPFVLATTVFVAAIGMAVDRINLRCLAIYGGLGLILASVLSYVFTNYLFVQIG